jgi:hypothetical protein
MGAVFKVKGERRSDLGLPKWRVFSLSVQRHPFYAEDLADYFESGAKAV